MRGNAASISGYWQIKIRTSRVSREGLNTTELKEPALEKLPGTAKYG